MEETREDIRNADSDDEKQVENEEIEPLSDETEEVVNAKK